MDKNLKDVFKEKLIELYGEYHPIISKFGTSPFGKISSDLCISSSQFSKLISGSATEGMYIRSIRNIEQLIEHQRVLKESKQVKKELSKSKNKPKEPSFSRFHKILISTLLFASLIFGSLIGFYFTKENNKSKPLNLEDTHPLSQFFNKQDNKKITIGFLDESEVQDYCPSSAYEGKWELAHPYKIPLPGSKNSGVYLLAKSADIVLVTSKYAANKGRVLLGFEHLTHEIWLDKRRRPLSPIYFDTETKSFTELFHNLDFKEDDNFVKIADLKSFFLDEFTIGKDFITRKGQPSGRYIDFINRKLAKTYDIDVEYILNEVISDLTKTKCNSTINEYCNPNDLKVNSTISFDCIYSIGIENLGIGGGYPYTKTIKLVEKNYSDNLICDCSE